jgi:hypothetical protein
MRFKYRIKVYDIVQKFEGDYNVVKQYMPQRMENTFMGRILGWYNLTEYPCYEEEEARKEVEKDKLYWNVRTKADGHEDLYINID